MVNSDKKDYATNIYSVAGVYGNSTTKTLTFQHANAEGQTKSDVASHSPTQEAKYPQNVSQVCL